MKMAPPNMGPDHHHHQTSQNTQVEGAVVEMDYSYEDMDIVHHHQQQQRQQQSGGYYQQGGGTQQQQNGSSGAALPPMAAATRTESGESHRSQTRRFAAGHAEMQSSAFISTRNEDEENFRQSKNKTKSSPDQEDLSVHQQQQKRPRRFTRETSAAT